MDLKELNRQDPGFPGRHPWESVRARIARFLVARQQTSFQHVIDVGAGDAFVLASISESKLSSRFSAIDQGYDKRMIAHLEQQYPNLDFYQTVEAAVFQDSQRPDLVLLMDVLEHTNNEHGFLSPILDDKLTAHRATVLITVPAFQFLFSSHDKALDHFRRYSLKQLRRLCEDEELQVIRSGYFFTTLLPVRILQKLFGGSGIKTIDNWTASPTVTRLITAVLWLDFRICFALSSIGIRLPGLSCYCLCQKSPL